MKLHSNLSKKEYLHAMKDYMSGHFDFGTERFTGFFLGSLFYVTYHSGMEWNRRITNQKNAAIGIVKDTTDGCSVYFLRFKGLFCPLHFLSLLLIMLLICPFAGGHEIELSIKLQIAILATVIYSPIYTVIESLTQRSEDGRRALLSLLIDPSDPYGNICNIP